MSDKSGPKWKYWLAAKMIRSVKMALGLDQVKVSFVVGASLSEETKKFFMSLDLPLIDLFGLSETSGGVTFNLGQTNLKTVGKAIQGVEIKIDKPDKKGEGEIFVRGPCVFMGYVKDRAKTLDALTADGWLKTGDLGYLDAPGNLFLSGRLKEIIITSGGENIPPVHIENAIKAELPCLSNVLVIGDNRKYLTALITFKTDIDPDTGYPLDTLQPEAIDWLESLGVHYSKLSELLHINFPHKLDKIDLNSLSVKCDRKVWQALEEGIKRYNQQAFSNVQKVQYFTILPHDFSIPTGELGPTLKIRRSAVHQKYEVLINKMYR